MVRPGYRAFSFFLGDIVEATDQKIIRMGMEVNRAKKRVSQRPPPSWRAMYHGVNPRRPKRK